MGELCAQQSLTGDLRINGKSMRPAFQTSHQVLQKSSALVYIQPELSQRVAYATVLSSDGFLLTKASEIGDGTQALIVRIDRQIYRKVRWIASDPLWDVALLKVDGAQGLEPVQWREQEPVLGQWLISNGASSRLRRRIRVGVLAAQTRQIPLRRAPLVLGVFLKEKRDEKNGAYLEVGGIAVGQGADKAGVKQGDIFLEAEGLVLHTREDLLSVLFSKKAGDYLEMVFLRGGKKHAAHILLSLRPQSKPSISEVMGGGDFALSHRREGFSRVLHHDTPLVKTGMGGPLLDLDGHCVGMNIARSSRVATFAIPSRECQKIAAELMEKARGH